MAREVRLMPALIAVSLGALAFKAVAIAEAATEAADTSHDAPSHDAPAHDDGHEKASASDDHGADVTEYYDGYDSEGYAAEDMTAGDACLSTPDFSAETGLSQYEIQVLRSLADRRQELDSRAEELDTREQMAAAAEVRLDEQIAELKSLESGVQALLVTMEQKRDERLDGLVKVYESMKPKDAARIFNALDNGVLLEVSQRMKSATLAAVMASMTSERAEQLTRLLAERAELPASAEDVLGGAQAG